MSTRGHIVIKLHKEDIGKTIQQDMSKLKFSTLTQNLIDYFVKSMNVSKEYMCKVMGVPLNDEKRQAPPITLEDDYIMIYNHSDSYIDALGKELIKSYNDYNSILNVVIGGNLSCLADGVDQHYSKGLNNFNWDTCKPIFTHEEPHLTEEYIYLYNNNKWWFKNKENNEEWIDLAAFIIKEESTT